MAEPLPPTIRPAESDPDDWQAAIYIEVRRYVPVAKVFMVRTDDQAKALAAVAAACEQEVPWFWQGAEPDEGGALAAWFHVLDGSAEAHPVEITRPLYPPLIEDARRYSEAKAEADPLMARWRQLMEPPRPAPPPPAPVDAWAACAKRLIGYLERRDWPDNGMCNHLGVRVTVPGWPGNVLQVTRRPQAGPGTPNVGKLLLIMETKAGVAAAVHAARREAVAEALGRRVAEHWNGADLNQSTYMVLDCPLPIGLEHALFNYRQMPDKFNPTAAERAGFQAFDSWMAASYLRPAEPGGLDAPEDPEGGAE